MAENKIAQECMYYGTTTNEHPNVRSLLSSAANEIARLEWLHNPVHCAQCKREIRRADDWYRCFDCKSYLCADCVENHFRPGGEKYTPHHRHMEQYEQRIEILEANIKRLEARKPINANQMFGPAGGDRLGKPGDY